MDAPEVFFPGALTGSQTSMAGVMDVEHKLARAAPRTTKLDESLGKNKAELLGVLTLVPTVANSV